MTDNKHLTVVVRHIVCLTLFRRDEAWDDHAVEQDKQRRRQQHRQGDNQQQTIRQLGWDHAVGNGKRQQDKAEFTRLREAQREQPAVRSLDLEHDGQHIKHRGLQRHQAQCQPDDQPKVCAPKAKVDSRTDGHKEQAQQQALERVNVTF